MSPVRVQVDDGVAEVQLDDAASHNAFSEAMVHALGDALRAVGADPQVRALVLTGLPTVFCSGAPQELLLRLQAGDLPPSDIALAGALLDVPIPTIAAMEGHAIGGGLALGFCADVVIMARESRYGANFMEYGFTPGMGTTRLLEHALSPAVAHELLFTAELRRGRDFEGRSGVNHVVARAEVRGRAFDVARRIAEKPRSSLEMLKATLAGPRRAAFAAAVADEAAMHARSFALPETRARILDLFPEKAP